jgi:sphingosine kinase
MQASRQELYSTLLNKEVVVSLKFRGSPCNIQLTTTQLIVGNPKRTEIPFLRINTCDIIGVLVKGDPAKKNILEVIYYPLAGGCCSSHKHGNLRTRKAVSLDFLDNARTCENWQNVIRYIISGTPLPSLMEEGRMGADVADLKVEAPPSRHFLVVVNPVGGKRQGKQIWHNHVEPMLKEAGVVVTLLITERANHARDAVLEMETDPSATFHAVLCVGGDGIVFEVVNGMISREGGAASLQRLPIVHVPGGTGNGLAKSILFTCNEACTPRNAVFVAIRGHRQALDLSRITTSDGKDHISFLFLAWGLVADVDILSETMRYLGETRLYIAAVYFMMRRRYYSGRLRMLLQPGAPVPECTNMRQAEDGFTVIESPFLMVWAMQTSHSGITIHSGPGARPDDGVFTVAVVQTMSRLEMTQLLLGIDEGHHFKHPKVKVFKCTDYSLEPLTEKGLFSLDGEVVPYGMTTAKVLPAAATVLTL